MEKYQVVAQKGTIVEDPEIILRCISRDENALAVAQKLFKSLHENASNTMHVSAHLAILVDILDVCKLVFKELTSWGILFSIVLQTMILTMTSKGSNLQLLVTTLGGSYGLLSSAIAILKPNEELIDLRELVYPLDYTHPLMAHVWCNISQHLYDLDHHLFDFHKVIIADDIAVNCTLN